MSDVVTITLIDDHTIVRNGLKSLIEVMGNYKVTEQYDNGAEFIAAFPLKHQPDVVIMDLNMPEMNGLETVRWMHKNKIALKVLILTLESDERTIIELFRLGVRGYLPKSCSAEVLKRAIDDTVATGYYHSDILQKAFSSAGDKKAIDENMTDREKEFLQLICKSEEYTYEQIAEIMNLSKRTIDGYRESLFQKCDVRSKTGLVLFAIKHGLVEL